MASLPLVGREIEVATCAGALERAVAGALGVVLVEGEPGGGKTRLLEHVAALGAEEGFTCRTASADPFGESRAYGLVGDALDLRVRAPTQAQRDAARLLHGDALRRGDPALPLRVLDSVLAVLDGIVAAGPALLVLEDLHWADASSLSTIAGMASNAADLPVALLLDFRPAPRRDELGALVEALRRRDAAHVVLPPLSSAAVEELAHARLAAAPGGRLSQELVRAAGNPLYVLEMLDELERQGAIEVRDGVADISAVALPASLSTAVGRRLAHLSADVLEVLRLATVLGSSFSLAALSSFSRRSGVALAPLLIEAVQLGVLVGDDELRFRHDVVREAIYEDIPAALRRRLHYEAGLALAERGTDPAVVARQLSEGAEPGDPVAIAWLRDAAASLAERAPAVAADLLRRALALVVPDDPRGEEMVAELVTSLVWSGRSDEAEATARDAIAGGASPATRARLRVALVQLLLAGGRLEAAVEEAARALDEEALSEQDRGDVLAWESGALLLLGRLEESSRAAVAVLRTPHATGLAHSAAVATNGAIAYLRAHLADACALAEEAVAIADSSPGHRAHRFHSTLFQGAFLIEADRTPEARAVLQRGRRFCERFGTMWNAPLYHGALAQAHLYDGTWGDAETEARTALALAADTGTFTGCIWAHSTLAMLALHAGDLRAAELELQGAEEMMRTKGPDYRATWMLWASALFAEARGRGDDALAALSTAWQWVQDLPFLPDAVVIGPDLVRLLLAGGEEARARDVAAEVERVAARLGARSARAAADHCVGVVDRDARRVLRAADAFHHVHRPLSRAQALEAAGSLLLADDERDQAARAFAQARDVLEDLGAHRDAARIRALLRSTGVAHGTRTRRLEAKEGWDSLTESERRVVALIRDGLTYRVIAERLFLSPRTVERHAANTMRKLGVRSRSELMALLARGNGFPWEPAPASGSAKPPRTSARP